MARGPADFLAREWRRRTERFVRELERATVEATDAVYAASRQALQSSIYNVPVPTYRNKRGREVPLWRRTGNLRRSERRRAAGLTGIIYNEASYARERHERGRGTEYPRKAHWRDEAVSAAAAEVRRIYRDAVKRALAT